MDDRDLQAHLESLTEEEREEIRTFAARFHQQLDARIELLLRELHDPVPLSDEDWMRDPLLRGYVPLVDDAGKRIYKKREDLTLEDMRRFAAFMDADAERRKREIGDLAEESEN